MDELSRTGAIAAAGLKVQATRLRIVSENLANAESMPDVPGGDPYRRKMITFRNEFDKAVGADLVRVNRIVPDKTEFRKVHDPSHPAAGPDGYVKKPNVNQLIEMMDMREAQRTYEANLNVIQASKDMMKKTIDMLR